MESENDTPVPTHVEVDPTKSRPEHDGWHAMAEFIRTILIVAIVAYCIRFFVLQPFVVEGSSMYPRFHTNDFLIVDKISYRLHPPKHGDIIVFEYPGDPTRQTNYVKRIIGLPGDIVTITNGKVTVTNSSHPQGVALDEPYVGAGESTTLPAGTPNSSFTVPDSQYFVLGDNRPASSDSREWGFVPSDHIIGKVVLEAFPVAEASVVHSATYDGLDN